MKKILITFILITTRLMIFGQEDIKSGIIYGVNHAFALTAPEGWVLDNQAGVSQGLYAVFYRKGAAWKEAETVMYANTSPLKTEGQESIGQIIEYDSANFRKNYPDISIISGEDIVIKENLIAKVRYFSGKSYPNFEAVAYIDAGKTCVMIILSSRSRKDFDNSRAAFGELVKSYLFISDNVIINSEKE